MSVSGFRDQFFFYGFLPNKDGEIDKVLSLLKNITYSLVFFIPGVKINSYLKKFKEFFSGRKILIAKELTKVHEELIREDITNIKINKAQIKGELTVVISDHKFEKKLIKIKLLTKQKISKKYSLKDTVEPILKTEKFKKKFMKSV